MEMLVDVCADLPSENALSLHSSGGVSLPASATTFIPRFIGLDIHKEYFVAIGVDASRKVVFGPQTVPNSHLQDWACKFLSPQDHIVLEMTVNSYYFHDILLPHVASVTIVHPPHVKLVTQVAVKTDRKAAQTLAELHAVGLLEGIWVPPVEVRELRALIAHRQKMIHLSTRAKNRLSTALHRNQLVYPGEHPSHRYHPDAREWFENLPVSPIEKLSISTQLDTLEFVRNQVAKADVLLEQLAAADPRVPLLVQLPGCALLTAMSILAAIGDVSRFPNAKKLVGYAGLGTRVHDSGMTRRTGRITKAGRKDLRYAMVVIANNAADHHPYWKEEFAKLFPRLGRSKAIVAIARRLLVAVWHILSKQEADRHAVPKDVARSFFNLAYKIGVRNLPDKHSALSYTRYQLDRLGVGNGIDSHPLGHALPQIAAFQPYPKAAVEVISM